MLLLVVVGFIGFEKVYDHSLLWLMIINKPIKRGCDDISRAWRDLNKKWNGNTFSTYITFPNTLKVLLFLFILSPLTNIRMPENPLKIKKTRPNSGLHAKCAQCSKFPANLACQPQNTDIPPPIFIYTRLLLLSPVKRDNNP